MRKHVAKRTTAEVDAALVETVAFLDYCKRNNMLPGEKKPRVSIFQPAHPGNELTDLYSDDLHKLVKMAHEGDVEANYTLRTSILDDAKNGALTPEKHDLLGWLLLAPQPKPPARPAGRDELRDRNFLIATAV